MKIKRSNNKKKVKKNVLTEQSRNEIKNSENGKLSCLSMFANKKSSISNNLIPNELDSDQHVKQIEIEQIESKKKSKQSGNFFLRYFFKSKLYDKNKQNDNVTHRTASNEVTGANHNLISNSPTSDVS